MGCPCELGRIIDELREHHKVVVVSYRGHGRSEIGQGAVSLGQKTEDMLAVTEEKVTDSPAALLGFSAGAYTAPEVAALKPRSPDCVGDGRRVFSGHA